MRPRTRRVAPETLRARALAACTPKQLAVVAGYLDRSGGWHVERFTQWPVPAAHVQEYGHQWSILYLNTADKRNFLGVKPDGSVVLAQSDNTVTTHLPWAKR